MVKEPADRDIGPLFVTKHRVPGHRLVPAITIHHLLTHTSGLDSHGLGSAVAGLPAPGLETTLASYMGRCALGFGRGSKGQ